MITGHHSVSDFSPLVSCSSWLSHCKQRFGAHIKLYENCSFKSFFFFFLTVVSLFGTLIWCGGGWGGGLFLQMSLHVVLRIWWSDCVDAFLGSITVPFTAKFRGCFGDFAAWIFAISLPREVGTRRAVSFRGSVGAHWRKCSHTHTTIRNISEEATGNSCGPAPQATTLKSMNTISHGLQINSAFKKCLQPKGMSVDWVLKSNDYLTLSLPSREVWLKSTSTDWLLKSNDCLSGSGDNSVVRAPSSWLKGPRFEERRENCLLQGQLSVLTLISVSVPPPCYCSST